MEDEELDSWSGVARGFERAFTPATADGGMFSGGQEEDGHL